MTEHELLKLAAKAGGILNESWSENEAYFDGVLKTWDPRNDDGDSLRLATACLLGVSIVGGRYGVVECVSFKECHCFVQTREVATDGDLGKAVRRAIFIRMPSHLARVVQLRLHSDKRRKYFVNFLGLIFHAYSLNLKCQIQPLLESDTALVGALLIKLALSS